MQRVQSCLSRSHFENGVLLDLLVSYLEVARYVCKMLTKTTKETAVVFFSFVYKL